MVTPSKLSPPTNNFCLYPPPVLRCFWKDPLMTPHPHHPTSSIFYCYPPPHPPPLPPKNFDHTQHCTTNHLIQHELLSQLLFSKLILGCISFHPRFQNNNKITWLEVVSCVNPLVSVVKSWWHMLRPCIPKDIHLILDNLEQVFGTESLYRY